jgi:MFS transporter, DHA3 family, macrolide efflux protein
MRKFRVLWVGQFLSLLGSGLSSFALGVWIYERTGSATQYAMIFLIAFVPGIVMSPMAGTVADRFSRRAILFCCDGAGIACMVALASLYSAGVLRPWQIYITTAVYSIMAAFQIPAFASSIPLLVPKKDIGRANGLMMLAQSSSVIAPVLAGFLLTEITLKGVIIVDAASFLANSAALLLVPIPRPHQSAADALANDTMLGSWSVAWQYIQDHRGFTSLIGYNAALTLLCGFVDVLFTPVVLGFASARALGLVLTVGGIGMAVGSLLISAAGGPKRRMNGVVGFAVPLGLAMCAGALRPNIGLIAVAAFFFLFCTAIIESCMQSIWQVKVEPGLQGRVLALNRMIGSATQAVAFALVGPIADHWFEPLLLRGGSLAGSVGKVLGTGPGRGMALLVGLLGVVVVAIAACGYLLPSLRRLEDSNPDAISEDEPAEAVARQPASHEQVSATRPWDGEHAGHLPEPVVSRVRDDS